MYKTHNSCCGHVCVRVCARVFVCPCSQDIYQPGNNLNNDILIVLSYDNDILIVL